MWVHVHPGDVFGRIKNIEQGSRGVDMKTESHKQKYYMNTVLYRVLMVGVLLISFQVSSEEFDSLGDGVLLNVESESVTGQFDGMNMKTNQIWVDDMVYLLSRPVNVVGTPTKLGLLSDIKQGEAVTLKLKYNNKTPSQPYVIKIERH